MCPTLVYYLLSKEAVILALIVYVATWMDLLGGGCTPLAQARGGAGGAIFHDRAKND